MASTESTLFKFGAQAVTSTCGSLLYSPGVFYFYPFKPVLHAAIGDSYDVGYKYFRRDHNEPTNVALHLVALVWQLLGNFGLLKTLDIAIRDHGHTLDIVDRPLSLSSAVLWALMQLFSSAPWSCRILSTLMIAGAYNVAPLLDARILEVSMISAFLVVVVICALIENAVHPGKPRYSFKNAIKIAGLDYLRQSIYRMVPGSFLLRGVLKEVGWLANALLVCSSMFAGGATKPLQPMHRCCTVLSRVLGELTDQEWMIFYGQQGLASYSQGIAHRITRQASTLGSHQANKRESRWTKLGFESSHVVYFPSFCLHTTMQSLFENPKQVSKDNSPAQETEMNHEKTDWEGNPYD